MKLKKSSYRQGLIALAVMFTACSHKPGNKLFSSLPASESGIHFSNDLHDADSSYSFINEFGYMGGGVGIGDFNNDGLKDIFFTGNQVSCRLYINTGNNRFEDLTEKAGVTTDAWATGVSIVDINNDGYDDIYVCVFGKDLKQRSKNLLFVNQHNLAFKEEAEEYGLADTGYSTQAIFFDYDKDGDLDMYLANYLLSRSNANSIIPRDRSGNSPANDRLYRNDGTKQGKGHPVFSDVTSEAGIKEDGYGLGLSVSDLNNDGWPDIYVANDFLSNDELWLNNRNGTFINCISRSLEHQSYSSMGCDAADINNDTLPDIVTLDMLPEMNERKKTSFSFMNYERYQAERGMGYEPEFMRNMLQLNNGVYRSGDTAIPFFSEIGRLAGIHQTDWSWSVLLADFNNDGWKDMHITNGIGRDFINADFLEFSGQVFNSEQPREEQEKIIRKKLSSLKHIELANYLYLNERGIRFRDLSDSSGTDEPSMSNGAAYADLDNDGDMDLVINNINREAFVLINNTIQKNSPVAAHFLRIALRGDSLNTRAFGAKIFVYTGSVMQVHEENPVRGYFSSVDQQLLFGLGKYNKVDSLVVAWPDNKRLLLANLPADTIITLSWKNKETDFQQTKAKEATAPFFSDITSSSGISYRHSQASVNDFTSQRLLPQKFSELGPFTAMGDINNDHLADIFIAGTRDHPAMFFIQQKDRTFVSREFIPGDRLAENMDCIFLDADRDGDADLLVSWRFDQRGMDTAGCTVCLYSNDGKGNFSLRKNAISSAVKTIAGIVTAGDYNSDGYPDIFIGGRVSDKYPVPPRSFLLRNNKGTFTDVTEEVCPGLKNPGMITAAAWVDFDGDNFIDLVVAGEWMPLRFFKNDHGKFNDVTGKTGLTGINGMWRSLMATDIDNDGDTDLIAGNLGLNCEYNVNDKEPMELYASDIDGNGSIDPVLFYYIKNREGKRQLYPAINRALLASQVPSIKKQFLFNKDYAQAGISDIFKGKAKEGLLHFECNETRTCFFENAGNGKFVKHILPVEAQFAPVNSIICEDFDKDGAKDILLAGNEYQTEVVTGRYDASFGLLLKGTGNKEFKSLPAARSGMIIKGDVKAMTLFPAGGGPEWILAAVNNDSLRVFRVNQK